MSTIPANLLFLGAPGAGKGTQASIISSTLSIPHISTGDMFRAEAASGSELGKKLNAIMAAGKLIDDDTTNEVVEHRLQKDDCVGGFILDGYPRTDAQAAKLDEILSAKGAKLSHVVELRLPDEEVVSRISGRFTCKKCGEGYHETNKKPDNYELVIKDTEKHDQGVCTQCGATEFKRRKDDTEEAAAARVASYHDQTAPLKDYYSSKGLLETVEANQSFDAVTQDLLKVIAA